MGPVGARHEVAIVRVEVREANGSELLIELLEVGHRPYSDRLLGRATNAVDACQLLQDWLVMLAESAPNR
jgi:hypothetical protein